MITLRDQRSARIFALFLCLLLWIQPLQAAAFEDIASGFHTIQSRRIRSTLQFLASRHFRGRGTGSPEAAMTADYIASIFERNGLQPPPGNSGRHVQEFDLVQAVPQKDCRLTVALQEGANLDLKLGEDFMPAPWGPDASAVSGQLAFAGYGISAPELSYDDFASANVAGKIAVVFSKFPGGPKQSRWDFYSQKDYEEPWEKARQSQAAGALGVLIILPSSESVATLDSLNFKNAKTHLASDMEGVRIPVLFLSYPAAEKLFRSGNSPDLLKEIQDKIDADLNPVSLQLEKTVSLTVRYERKSLKGYNVIGIIPGSDSQLRDECILISAHHDHMGFGEDQEIYFGADDNASGTTAVLELAEAYQAGPLRPRRSIVLAAWGAEELGLLAPGIMRRIQFFLWPRQSR